MPILPARDPARPAREVAAQPEIGPDHQQSQAFDVLLSMDAPNEDRAAAAARIIDAPVVDWPRLTQAMNDQRIRSLIIETALVTPARASALLQATDPATLTPPDRLRLINSLRTTRNRQIVSTLVRELRAEETRQAALEVLVTLTGRADLGHSPSRWEAWDQSRASLSDTEWSERLLWDVIERRTAQELRAQRAERALAEAYRRLYLLTEAPARPALLIELLNSDQTGLQMLGFELSDRELASSAALDPAVAEAAIGLLKHPTNTVRANAARLINRLAPPNAADFVMEALINETDATAADALLFASARWPSPQLVEPAMRWLGNPITRESASQAGIALFDAGLIVGDEARERIRSLLTPVPTDASAARLILVALTGIATDREEIAALLSSETPRMRQAAAEALARTDAGVPLLIEAAKRNTTIAPEILGVLARHDRLDAAVTELTDSDMWIQAFEQSTAPRVRAGLASRILSQFDESLTDDQRAIYQAAASPGG